MKIFFSLRIKFWVDNFVFFLKFKAVTACVFVLVACIVSDKNIAVIFVLFTILPMYVVCLFSSRCLKYICFTFISMIEMYLGVYMCFLSIYFSQCPRSLLVLRTCSVISENSLPLYSDLSLYIFPLFSIGSLCGTDLILSHTF